MNQPSMTIIDGFNSNVSVDVPCLLAQPPYNQYTHQLGKPQRKQSLLLRLQVAGLATKNEPECRDLILTCSA